MSYYMRTDKGSLFGKVDNRMAGMMLEAIDGEWTEKNFLGGSKKVVFVVSQDSVYGNDIMKFFLFKGYYLEKVK